MYATKIPKFLHLWLNGALIDFKKSFVDASGQNLQFSLAFPLTTVPPAVFWYAAKNSEHVWPDLGCIVNNSYPAQVTFVLAKPVDNIPGIQYAKGTTLYIKIQNPGNASGPAKTPQKSKDIPNNIVAKFAAFFTTSLNEIHKWPIDIE